MGTTAIILAGGQSSRMGTNKALLQLKGKTVIEGMVERLENIVDDILIVTNTFEDYAFLHLPMIEDKRKGKGPLAGMEAGLAATQTERNLIVAFDMPFILVELGKYFISLFGGYKETWAE